MISTPDLNVPQTFGAPALQPSIRSENLSAARTWDAGAKRYERISGQIADAIEHCIDRLGVRSEERILDIATGTGFGARRLAAKGADVVGVDIAAEAIDAARELDRPGDIDFRVADAEALPFPDARFDAVISTFGVMFCGDAERAARELGRVCRPGGRLALATWAQHGGVAEMFEVISRYKSPAPAGSPSPFDWGDTGYLVKLLEEDFDLGFEEGTSYYREASGDDAWEAFATGYGPLVTLLAKLDDDAATTLRHEFVTFHERHRTGVGVLVPRPYLITVGRRRS